MSKMTTSYIFLEKWKKPPAKIARRLEGTRGTRIRGIKALTSGRRPDRDCRGAVVPAAADAEPAGIEKADVDTAAARAETGCADPDFLKQPLAGGEEVSDDSVDHHLGRVGFLLFRQESLLIAPVLAEGIRDRSLADQVPFDLSVLVREGLAIVPILLVEQARDVRHLGLSGLGPDRDERDLEDGDEDMRVLAGRENFLGERNLGQVCHLAFRGVNPEVLHRLFKAEEVPAHDGPSFLMAGRGFDAAVPCVCGHAVREDGFGVDTIDCDVGIIAERDHEPLECAIGLS